MRLLAALATVASLATLPGAAGAQQQYRITAQLRNRFDSDAFLYGPHQLNDRAQAVWSTMFVPGVSYFWDGTAVTHVGGTATTPPPGVFSYAHAVNDAGRIAGESWLGPSGASTTTRAFVTGPDGTGGMTRLGLLPGGDAYDEALSAALGINNLDQLVGISTNAAGVFEGFLTEPGSTTLVGIGSLPGGTGSMALAIGDGGHVVGSAGWPGGVSSGFIRLPGGVGGLQAIPLTPADVDVAGRVVGDVRAGGLSQAYVTGADGVGMTSLGFLVGNDGGGTRHSTARGMNDLGQVVGLAGARFGGVQRAGGFVWDETNGMRLLSDLLTPEFAGWGIGTAYSINERGQIFALGFDPDAGGLTPYVPIILTPTVVTPEPGTVALVATGLLAVAGVARRRKRTSAR